MDMRRDVCGVKSSLRHETEEIQIWFASQDDGFEHIPT